MITGVSIPIGTIQSGSESEDKETTSIGFNSNRYNSESAVNTDNQTLLRFNSNRYNSEPLTFDDMVGLFWFQFQ